MDLLLIRAARGERTERTPVWLMRQAGRYLKEYQALRQQYGFMEICRQPELAARVSLLPWQAFEPDGVVMFSDIMFPLSGMNIEFSLEDGGPKVAHPVRTLADTQRICELPQLDDCVVCVQQLIQHLKTELVGRAAVIGFAGAPFTLATYLVEGQKSQELEIIKRLMYTQPEVLKALLQKLTDSLITYCQAQADAGADVLQLFDTWAGMLSTPDYERWALPYQQQIFSALKNKLPTLLFVRAATGYLELLKLSGAGCISLDWRIEIPKARAILGADFPVQGNLDPAVLLGDIKHVEAETKRLIAAGGHRGHILNLGHGLLPSTPRENVQRFIEISKTYHV